jgi:hypothetical protein
LCPLDLKAAIAQALACAHGVLVMLYRNELRCGLWAARRAVRVALPGMALPRLARIESNPARLKVYE